IQCATARLIGDLPRALRAGEEAVGAHAEFTPHYFSLLGRSHLAAVHLDNGDPARCVGELVAICVDPSRPIEQRFRPVPCEVLTRAELAREDKVAAGAWAQRAAEVAQVFPVPARRGEALRSEAEVALALGERGRAFELAQSAAAVTEAAGRALETARA